MQKIPILTGTFIQMLTVRFNINSLFLCFTECNENSKIINQFYAEEMFY